MTTIITKNGTGIPQRVSPATDLEARLERALKQIRDLERELSEVLDRLSALEDRG
jgi:predicted  nucleic acid-binding Zn-ribbon protein